MPIIRHDEAMQVEIETVLNRGTVDLGDEPARFGERRAINSHTIADGHELARRVPRMPAAASADVDAELA